MRPISEIKANYRLRIVSSGEDGCLVGARRFSAPLQTKDIGGCAWTTKKQNGAWRLTDRSAWK